MLRRNAPQIAAVAGAALLVGVLLVIVKAWYDSRLPGTYSVMSFGAADYGGGTVPADHAGHEGHGGVSVADLRAPRRRRTTTSRSPQERRRCGLRRATRSTP